MITWKESAQEEVRVIYEYLLDQVMQLLRDVKQQKVAEVNRNA